MGFFSKKTNKGSTDGAVVTKADIIRAMLPAWLQFFSFTGDKCTPPFTIDLTTNSGAERAYERCGTLKTVVNRNAQAMSNGRWWVVDAKDNDESAKYPGLMRLLSKPNPLQTFMEFIQQADVLRQLKGGFFVYAPMPSGYSDVAQAKAMWVIDPDYIEVETTGRIFMQTKEDEIIQRYYLNVGGTRTELKREHVLYIRDVNQNLQFGVNGIKGKSRLTGISKSIENLVLAEEALYAMNKQRGPMGILANESKDVAGQIDLKPGEKEQIQKELIEGYGLSLAQAKIIITNASLKWQPISYNVDDLKLFDGMDQNIQFICDAFDYPYHLLSSQDGTTYENQKESRKSYYENSIIPMSMIYAQSFTEFFGIDIAGRKIVIDFEHMPIFKTAEKDKASALSLKVTALEKLYKIGAISMEEMRLGLEYDEKIYGGTMYNQNDNSDGQGADQEAQGAES